MYERSVCFLEESAATFSIRNGFWFHVDAASGGTYLPFLEMAVHQGLLLDIFPTSFFDYRILEVNRSRQATQVVWVPMPSFISGMYCTLSGS